MPHDLMLLNARFGKDEQAALRFALSGAAGRIAMVSSFGAESAALLHLVAGVAPDTPVLFIDTQMLFPETSAYQRALTETLGLTDVRIIGPSRNALFEADTYGIRRLDHRTQAVSGRRSNSAPDVRGGRRNRSSEDQPARIVGCKRHCILYERPRPASPPAGGA
jgi:3'-phosphoadenosine 5'-phosphosulfate sulfotransferase (PAPS reductase)/FAD synthetase